jgi:hypothetical protein
MPIAPVSMSVENLVGKKLIGERKRLQKHRQKMSGVEKQMTRCHRF